MREALAAPGPTVQVLVHLHVARQLEPEPVVEAQPVADQHAVISGVAVRAMSSMHGLPSSVSEKTIFCPSPHGHR